MGNLSETKERVRQAVDLVQVVGEQVALTRTGNRFKGLCPFHKEKTPSFHVVPEKGIFHCFGCKAGGDLFKFVQLREGVSFPEAVRMLADRAGIAVDDVRGTAPTGPSRRDLVRVNEWAASWFRSKLLDPEAGRSTRQYIESRGISDESAERFGLGLASGANATLLAAARLKGISPELLEAVGLIKQGDRGRYDAFRDRLIFPIRDAMRRVVGFGGRTLSDAPAKYLNTAQNTLFDKSRTLYGVDLARPAMTDKGRVIVVEGYTDCIACHQAGFTETVATLGTAMTEAHVDLIRRYCQEVVLVFDSDDAGAAAADRALQIALQHGLSVRLAFVPEKKDPCDFVLNSGADAFNRVLMSASDALGFTWERLEARYHGESNDVGRRHAIRELVDLVSSLARAGGVDVIQQGLIANRVGKLLGLPSEQVHALFHEKRPVRAAEEAATPAQERPAGEQAALVTALEVVLAEPALYKVAEEVFIPHRIEDPVLRRIGQAVKESGDTLGEFTLLDVLDSLPDGEAGRQATELHLRGEQRGNLEATLQGAVGYLRQSESTRHTAGLARRLQQDGSGGDATAHLREIQDAARSFRHFAPRRRLSTVAEEES